MEVETAARKHLLSDGGVTGYVGQRVWKFRLMEPVDGTGLAALVVRRAGDWALPDTVQTPHFPRLEVQCWADPTRDDDGEVSTYDAEDRAWALAKVVDDLFHAARGETWGGADGLVVVTCQRWSEGVVIPPEVHKLGTDAVYVSREYALQTG